MTKRADWGRLIVGSRGDDDLKGTAGRDVIVGRSGADVLKGGAGNDLLIGDDAHGGWHHCFWWKPKGNLNDYLDGGAGSDFVLAGRGNDVANYTLSENARTHDVYDGGQGVDTLRLTLTQAELQLASVQQDIAAFKTFLAHRADPHSDHGKTFEFKSFNLDVRNFEALEIKVIGAEPPPVNTAPVARNDSFSLNEDSALVVPGPGVAGNDSDTEGSALSVALVAGPAHGALALNADGSFSYTPDADFNGSDSFSYRVSDGALDSNVATVALQVAPVNDAPVAVGEAFTTAEDTPLTGNVLGNDTDRDGDMLTAHLVDSPAFGALVLNADGTFIYSPNANFNGADSFTYRATDGSLDSAITSVDLTVASENDAPFAADDAFVTLEDTPVSGNVIGNDTDADGDSLTALLLDGPSHGDLDFTADGSYTYTPAADFNGLDSFTYQVSDGHEGSGPATVTLVVSPTNDAPVATDDVLSEQAFPGTIRVAVIGATTSGYVAAAAQLEDSTAFTMDADAISVTAFSTQAQWEALLEGYDVVVLGDNGTGMDYNSSAPLFAELREFVDAGGGVVTAGWFAFDLQGLSGTVRANADYITPISAQAYQYARTGSTVTVLDSSHPITEGITSYRVNPAAHELGGGVDSGATVLARGVNASGTSLPGLVVADVGQGHTAYFGSLQMASAGYSPERAAGSTVDTIFERAVAWAAGAQDVFAATDEDTPLAIDSAVLLANDLDIENDTLAISAVSATSALGAAVSIGAGGIILYDPTAALQSLRPGEVVADSFDYTILDGNGGSDIGTVHLTVAGRADTDPLL